MKIRSVPLNGYAWAPMRQTAHEQKDGAHAPSRYITIFEKINGWLNSKFERVLKHQVGADTVFISSLHVTTGPSA